MKGKQIVRNVKKVSLNQKELNELWIPVWEIQGEVGDSLTIKRALQDSWNYNLLKGKAEEYGLDLDVFMKKIKCR